MIFAQFATIRTICGVSLQGKRHGEQGRQSLHKGRHAGLPLHGYTNMAAAKPTVGVTALGGVAGNAPTLCGDFVIGVRGHGCWGDLYGRPCAVMFACFAVKCGMSHKRLIPPRHNTHRRTQIPIYANYIRIVGADLRVCPFAVMFAL